MSETLSFTKSISIYFCFSKKKKPAFLSFMSLILIISILPCSPFLFVHFISFLFSIIIIKEINIQDTVPPYLGLFCFSLSLAPTALTALIFVRIHVPLKALDDTTHSYDACLTTHTHTHTLVPREFKPQIHTAPHLTSPHASYLNVLHCLNSYIHRLELE